MYKAPDFGSGDCRFESCHGRTLPFLLSLYLAYLAIDPRHIIFSGQRVVKKCVRCGIRTHAFNWRPEFSLIPYQGTRQSLESGALDHSANLTTVGTNCKKRLRMNIWILGPGLPNQDYFLMKMWVEILLDCFRIWPHFLQGDHVA